MHILSDSNKVLFQSSRVPQIFLSRIYFYPVYTFNTWSCVLANNELLYWYCNDFWKGFFQFSHVPVCMFTVQIGSDGRLLVLACDMYWDHTRISNMLLLLFFFFFCPHSGGKSFPFFIYYYFFNLWLNLVWLATTST